MTTNVPRVDPDKPDTWPTCACGEPGAYLVRVRRPSWVNVLGEAQLGDYSGRGSTRFRRYYLACDGCKVIGELVDKIVGTADEMLEVDDG